VKRVRWVCPNGCAGVLGPSRPRKNNVVRYCLPCSAKAGVLVERSSPSVQKKSAAKSTSRIVQKKKVVSREEMAEFLQSSVFGLDLREVIKIAGRLPALKAAAKAPYKIWRGEEWDRSGRAWGHRFFLRFIKDNVNGFDTNYVAPEHVQRRRQSSAVGLILHEMAHVATIKQHGRKAAHDGSLKFGRCCQRAFAQWNATHSDIAVADEHSEGAYRGKRSRELKAEKAQA